MLQGGEGMRGDKQVGKFSYMVESILQSVWERGYRNCNGKDEEINGSLSVEEARSRLLALVREQVPAAKNYTSSNSNGLHQEEGWNNCRVAMLKKLAGEQGGGEG